MKRPSARIDTTAKHEPLIIIILNKQISIKCVNSSSPFVVLMFTHIHTHMRFPTLLVYIHVARTRAAIVDARDPRRAIDGGGKGPRERRDAT